MEREELGPWAPGGMVEGQRVGSPGGRRLASVSARSTPRSRPRRPPAARMDRRSGLGAALRNLVVIDGDERRSGLGLVGTYRPDVASSIADGSEVSGFVAYVRGEPDSPLQVVLLSPDGERPVCGLDESR